jgi:hypothetical protein
MVKKSVHIVLALLVLLSSTGFTVNMHFCHDYLIDMAVMAPAESCCDTGESGMQSCCAADPVTGTSPCEDKSVSIETSDDYMAENAVTGVKNIFHFTLPWLCSSEDEYHISNQKYSLTVPDLRRPPTDASVDLSGIQVFLL